MNPAVKWIGGALLGLVGVVFALLVMLGTMIETGVLPSDRVVAGAELDERHMKVLRKAGLLEPDETLELFFSEGLFSIKEGGSMLTDQRVLVFGSFKSYDDIDAYEILHEDIVSVEQTQHGDFINFAIYQVHSVEEDGWIELWLPHEFEDDKRFVNAIREKIQR